MLCQIGDPRNVSGLQVCVCVCVCEREREGYIDKYIDR